MIIIINTTIIGARGSEGNDGGEKKEIRVRSCSRSLPPIKLLLILVHPSDDVSIGNFPARRNHGKKKRRKGARMKVDGARGTQEARSGRWGGRWRSAPSHVRSRACECARIGAFLCACACPRVKMRIVAVSCPQVRVRVRSERRKEKKRKEKKKGKREKIYICMYIHICIFMHKWRKGRARAIVRSSGTHTQTRPLLR